MTTLTNKNLLSIINKHSLDDRVKFRDEGHVYWIDGSSKDLISSTTFIHSFFDDFNSDQIIKNILKSDKYKNDPSYKYYGMSYLEIKNQWLENGRLASEAGTAMHADIENFYNDLEVENDSLEFKQFLNFYQDHSDLEIYRTEWMIFSDLLKITGSVDAVFKNSDGTITIGDWKRSKEISMSSFGNKKGKFPFEHLADCNYYHYSLQLNLYRIILETFYGQKVKDMFLVVCHPDNKDDKYIKIPVKLMEKEASYLLDFRRQQIIKMGYPEETFKELNLKYKLPQKMSTNEYESDGEDEIVRPLLRKKQISDSVQKLPDVVQTPIIDNPIENKGKRWKVEDDTLLVESSKNGEDLNKLTFVFKRTANSLKIRLMQNILKICAKEKLSIEEVSKDFKQINIEELNSFNEENKIKEEEKTIKKLEKGKKKNEPKIVVEHVKKNTEKFSINLLSTKQKEAYNLIINGRNVLLTGEAGCGKSAIIKLFYNEYMLYKNISVTSTTGTSALLINGTTLHSFLGIGLGKASVDILYLNIVKKPYIAKRWRDLNVLVIDEISMLDPELFDKIEQLARSIRKNNKPFGGIQIVLSGDFLQLPNVSDPNSFCFEANSWSKCIDNVVYLTEIFRQNDEVFQKVLSEVRIGTLSDESVGILESRIDAELTNEFGIIPTKIYALNVDVDNENQRALDTIAEENEDLEFCEYNRTHSVLKKSLKFVDEKLKKVCIAPETLQLCIGAQVMLIYNLDMEFGLANGSRGVVSGFESDIPVVKFLNGETRTIDYHEWIIEENGEKILSICQIPLKVAYACSVHKIQGITLDYVEIDIQDIFEAGQAYVALSRVKTLAGLSIRNFNVENIFSNKKARKFYENL